jgi:hypothetical protein
MANPWKICRTSKSPKDKSSEAGEILGNHAAGRGADSYLEKRGKICAIRRMNIAATNPHFTISSPRNRLGIISCKTNMQSQNPPLIQRCCNKSRVIMVEKPPNKTHLNPSPLCLLEFGSADESEEFILLISVSRHLLESLS